MKPLRTYPSLLAALCLAVPSVGWAKDKHKHDCDDRGSHHHYSSSSRYCPPVVSYRSYRPYVGYSSYPAYYNYSPYYPAYSYYSRPSVGISIATTPSYYRATTRSGDYGDDLAVDVQRALARRGFYHGAIDGDVGPGTRGAIREYQYRNRLEVTGRIDRSLLRSLGLS
jgi:His-Xaa-Ser repeat protein HxsA